MALLYIPNVHYEFHLNKQNPNYVALFIADLYSKLLVEFKLFIVNYKKHK